MRFGCRHPKGLKLILIKPELPQAGGTTEVDHPGPTARRAPPLACGFRHSGLLHLVPAAFLFASPGFTHTVTALTGMTAQLQPAYLRADSGTGCRPPPCPATSSFCRPGPRRTDGDTDAPALPPIAQDDAGPPDVDTAPPRLPTERAPWDRHLGRGPVPRRRSFAARLDEAHRGPGTAPHRHRPRQPLDQA